MLLLMSKSGVLAVDGVKKAITAKEIDHRAQRHDPEFTY